MERLDRIICWPARVFKASVTDCDEGGQITIGVEAFNRHLSSSFPLALDPITTPLQRIQTSLATWPYYSTTAITCEQFAPTGFGSHHRAIEAA